MAATNPKALAYRAAKVYVVPMDDTIPEMEFDISNANAIVTAIDALYDTPDKELKNRMASITGLTLNVGAGETVQTNTDDNGTIYQAMTPQCTIEWNWHEHFNTDVLKSLMWLEELDDTAGNQTIYGQKLATMEIPSVAIVLETIPQPSNPVVERFYIVDTALTSTIALNFLDVVENGGVGNSPFTFTTNKNGGWLRVVPN